MDRRLAASLMLLACLFGIVQATSACVSSADCCRSGCSGQTQPSSGVVGLDDCCGVQAAAGTSFSLAPQTHQALDGVGFSSAVATKGDDLQPAPLRDMGVVRPAIRVATDQSLIYLLTARLRL